MFKCCFPGCPYETEHRALIDFHHIHLRELGSRLGSDVAIPLCPTHHKLIYHPEATSGQHSRKFAQSMVVKQVTDSTNGKCVIFEDMEGKEHVTFLDSLPTEEVNYVSWDILNGVRRGVVDSLDEAVMDRIRRDGMFDDGNRVLYWPENEAGATATLMAYISAYMKRAKSEFDSALEKARNDWSLLKQGAGSVPVVGGE